MPFAEHQAERIKGLACPALGKLFHYGLHHCFIECQIQALPVFLGYFHQHEGFAGTGRCVYYNYLSLTLDDRLLLLSQMDSLLRLVEHHIILFLWQYQGQ